VHRTGASLPRCGGLCLPSWDEGNNGGFDAIAALLLMMIVVMKKNNERGHPPTAPD
jgi:hypothetical protein